ncbi:MAG: SGNH/GDSL hydrolase family protein [Pseudomonas sp.]
MTIRTDSSLLHRAMALPRSVLNLLAVLGLSAALTGCGEMLSNPRVADADNNQVITIGDSIFALSGEIQQNLQAAAGQTFRQYTVSGSYLSGGFFATSIVDQYAIARSDNADITTVVMDGGGNDILFPVILFDPHQCKTEWYRFGRLSSKCQAFIDDIYIEAVTFLNEMEADGVENVIYLGYYYTKNGLFRLASLKEAIDYGDQALARACANSTVNCTFVDPRSSIVNKDIIFDGIHPNSTGSRKIADLIWPHLQPLL